MKFPFIKRPIFKSKETKWKEKLMKDYEEEKVLKIEAPTPHQENNNNQNNNHAHNHKKKNKHWRN